MQSASPASNSLSSSIGEYLSLAANCVGAVFAIFASKTTRQLLLALILIDLPLQVGTHSFDFGPNSVLNYRYDADDLGSIGGIDISITTFCLLLFLASVLLSKVLRKESLTESSFRINLPLTIYFLIAVLSTILVAADKPLALFDLVLFAQCFLLYLCVASTLRSRRDIQFVLTFLFVGLALESVLMIALGAAGHNFEALQQFGIRNRVDPNGEGAARVAGTIGDPNSAGAYLALLLPLAMASIVTRLPVYIRRFAFAAFCLGLAALLLTLSRGAWIAFGIAALIVMIQYARRHTPSRRSLVVFALIAIVLCGLTFYGPVAQRVLGDDQGSASSRIPLMEMSLDMIADYPVLGVGPNNFASHIYEYDSGIASDFIYTVHNQYLLILAELGPVGLAAFLWFLLQVIREGWRVWRKADPELSPIALAILAGLVGYMVNMNFELFRARAILELLFMFAAVIGAIEQLRPERLRTSRVPARIHVQPAYPKILS